MEPQSRLLTEVSEQPPSEERDTKPIFGENSPEFAVLALETSRNIRGKRAEGKDSRFAAGSKRVWAWFEVRNTEHRGHVIVRWGKKSPLARELKIHIGQNPRWHSWAPLDLVDNALDKDPAGWWTVEIASPEGKMMASKHFYVMGNPDDETK